MFVVYSRKSKVESRESNKTECKVTIFFLLLQMSRAHRRIFAPIWRKMPQLLVRPLRRQTVLLTERCADGEFHYLSVAAQRRR